MPLPSRARALVLCLALGGCAHSGLEGNVFRRGDVVFRVGPIPEHWRQLDERSVRGDLAAFAFRSDREGVTVGAAGRCGRDGDDVPLRSLIQHLTIGFTRREQIEERELRLDGRAALRVEMTAELDGVPKHLVFVVVKKDSCVYDFWRIAETNHDDAAEFDRFVAGFSTLN